WAIGNFSGMQIHPFDLIALEHRYIHKLARFVATVMFYDEQSRGGHFEHEAQARYCARSAPHKQLVWLAPDTQMNTRALDRRCHSREGRWMKWQRSLEYERMCGLCG